MKNVMKLICFVFILIIMSCEKQYFDEHKQYKFSVDEAINVLKKQLKESKNNKENSERKKIFENSKINWEINELETKNGVDMYYFNLSNVISIDSEKTNDKKLTKKPFEFDHFKRIAIKKNSNGTYTTYKVLYLQEKIDKTFKKNGLIKFSGKVIFLNINENFEFGYEYSNGEIVSEIKKQNGAKKGAKLSNCNYYQTFSIAVYVYVYVVPNYFSGDYHLSHTNYYEVWISCFSNSGVNTSTIFTGFGNSSGNGSAGFGGDGLVSSAYTGIPYSKTKTIIVKSNECDVFYEAIGKSNTFGIEYSGFILQGSNGPLYVILPPTYDINTPNTFNGSVDFGLYQDVSWGQGFIDAFEVVIDKKLNSLLVKLNGMTTAYATYNILGIFIHILILW